MKYLYLCICIFFLHDRSLNFLWFRVLVMLLFLFMACCSQHVAQK
jgi:hypothetical protein